MLRDEGAREEGAEEKRNFRHCLMLRSPRKTFSKPRKKKIDLPLHGSVLDQGNGTFAATRFLYGRHPGDVGHFLVAIRQWEPPPVKTAHWHGEKNKKVSYTQ